MNAKLVFLEADDAAIIRRFSETRRPHPLGTGRSIPQSIRSERAQLAPIRAMADLIINTSKFTVHELREFIGEQFRGQETRVEDPDLRHQLRLSQRRAAGQRPGVRCPLPAESQLHSALQEPDRTAIRAWRATSGPFRRRSSSSSGSPNLLIYLLPHYIREGKSYLTIAFGCTGGQHRSVMMADQIRKNLADAGFKAKVSHRDIVRRKNLIRVHPSNSN